MANPEGHVLVIGAASLDIKVRPRGQALAGTSNPADIRVSPGGSARNIAENLSRLGQATVFLSAVGADESGRRLLDQAAQAGIDTQHVAVRPGYRTGTYLTILDDFGTHALAFDDMSVIETLTPRYLIQRRALFADAVMLVVDANLSPAALRVLFRLARECDLPVYADPTSAVLAPRLIPYLDRLRLATPNVAEAEALLADGALTESFETTQQAAKRLAQMGIGLAVITQADLGLTYATADASGHIPAIQTDIVDATGAGDALTAATIFALLNDIPVDEALRLGVSAATLTLRSTESVVPELSLELLYDELVI
jgi:pseudouridine kinase